MARAVDYEVQRQAALLESSADARVVQETRLWEEGAQCTMSMRSKEGLADYRYYPEPDLPPVTASQALLEDVLCGMPELPAQARLPA
jgi:aspartyl-tRNA(Asn)/glutamyl-tRNA(Gln) amidotransferase subunit B